MSEIETFILNRVHELELASYGMEQSHQEATRKACRSIYATLNHHKSWPVLVETEPEYDISDLNSNFDTVRMTMVKKMEFLTAQEYIRRFGTEPPTAPIIKSIANQWSDHPSFQEEWRI